MLLDSMVKVLAPIRLKDSVRAYLIESMAVRLNADKASDVTKTIRIEFSDIKERYLLALNNSVLHHYQDDGSSDVDATLTLTHPLFVKMLIGSAGIKDTLFSDDLTIDGSVIDLVRFFMLFDKPDGQFNLVTP